MGNDLLPNIEIDPADCRPGNLVASNLGNNVVNDSGAYVTFGAGHLEIDAPSAQALNLNPGDDRYHYYSETHSVEQTRNLGDGPGQLYRNLTESPALQQLYNTSTSPIPHGEESSMIGFGTVETYRNDSEMTIMNVTTPDHLLADGLVSRQVDEIDGCTVITTSGIGTGDYGWLNKTFSNINWGADTASLSRETISEETGRQFSSDPRIIPEDMSEHIRTTGTEAMPMASALAELNYIQESLEQTREINLEHQEAYEAVTHPHVGRMFRALVDDNAKSLDVASELPDDPSERASVILQGAYLEFHKRNLNIDRVQDMEISEFELSVKGLPASDTASDVSDRQELPMEEARVILKDESEKALELNPDANSSVNEMLNTPADASVMETLIDNEQASVPVSSAAMNGNAYDRVQEVLRGATERLNEIGKTHEAEERFKEI